MKIIKEVGQISVPVDNMHIDAELKSHNQYRDKEEQQLLKNQIRHEGIIRDPFVIWKFNGKNYVIDGFTRHENLFGA